MAVLDQVCDEFSAPSVKINTPTCPGAVSMELICSMVSATLLAIESKSAVVPRGFTSASVTFGVSFKGLLRTRSYEESKTEKMTWVLVLCSSSDSRCVSRYSLQPPLTSEPIESIDPLLSTSIAKIALFGSVALSVGGFNIIGSVGSLLEKERCWGELKFCEALRLKLKMLRTVDVAACVTFVNIVSSCCCCCCCCCGNCCC